MSFTQDHCLLFASSGGKPSEYRARSGPDRVHAIYHWSGFPRGGRGLSKASAFYPGQFHQRIRECNKFPRPRTHLIILGKLLVMETRQTTNHPARPRLGFPRDGLAGPTPPAFLVSPVMRRVWHLVPRCRGFGDGWEFEAYTSEG